MGVKISECWAFALGYQFGYGLIVGHPVITEYLENKDRHFLQGVALGGKDASRGFSALFGVTEDR